MAPFSRIQARGLTTSLCRHRPQIPVIRSHERQGELGSIPPSVHCSARWVYSSRTVLRAPFDSQWTMRRFAWCRIEARRA